MSRFFLSLAICLASVPLSAAEKGTKYALLIGVSKYDRTQLNSLRFPERDVTRLGDVLVSNAGFPKRNVRLLTRTNAFETRNEKWMPTAKVIRRELRLLAQRAEKDDTVIIAFAGHGVQFTGEKENYFCPADADLSKKTSMIGLKGEVYQMLDKQCKARVKLLFVDACRNDPRSKINRTTRQIDLQKLNNPQALELPKGIAAFFSCKRGQEAFEDGDLKHGIFFHFVIEGLQGKAASGGKVTLSGLKEYVKRRVIDFVDEKLDQVQIPDLLESSTDVIILAQQQQGEIEETFTWKGRKRTRRVLRLDLGKGVTLDLVRIKKGTFKMGSPESDKEAYDDEKPQHTVELTKDFYIGKYEITKAQFARFVGDTGYQTEAESSGEGAYGWDVEKKRFVKDKKYNWKNVGFAQTDSHPVLCVTWNDAVAFCKWLKKKSGKSIQLPTEAQWEYSCRGGETTRYFTRDGVVSLKGYANVSDATAKAKLGFSSIFEFDDGYAFTSPVGKFLPNGFGLHDMTGNAWEWCNDSDQKYTKGKRTDPKGPDNGSPRILRGGAWGDYPRYCRCACRLRLDPTFRSSYIGFRVASSLD